jgi:transposase InsO family protein
LRRFIGQSLVRAESWQLTRFKITVRWFEAAAPNRKWIADFTYVWTAEGWLYVAAVIDLFSRRAVG